MNDHWIIRLNTLDYGRRHESEELQAPDECGETNSYRDHRNLVINKTIEPINAYMAAIIQADDEFR